MLSSIPTRRLFGFRSIQAALGSRGRSYTTASSRATHDQARLSRADVVDIHAPRVRRGVSCFAPVVAMPSEARGPGCQENPAGPRGREEQASSADHVAAGRRSDPYVNNPRTHSDEQVALIAGSIREFGWTNPVLIEALHRAGTGATLEPFILRLGICWTVLPGGSAART
jgi:hypothetical protein